MKKRHYEISQGISTDADFQQYINPDSYLGVRFRAEQFENEQTMYDIMSKPSIIKFPRRQPDEIVES